MKCFITILFITILATLSYAQSGLQNYTPSVLLLENQWEFKNFHNFYTQTKSFDSSGGKVLTGRGRENYYTMINQFLYGISDKVNIGFDVWIKSVNLENNSSANWTAATGVGPKIKVLPFGVPGFSFQSTLLFPLTKELEGNSERAFLEHDRILWINDIFYDKVIAPDFQVFMQLSVWYAFVRDSFRENNYAQTPLNAFLNYLPTNRLTIYFTTQYSPVHYNTSDQQAEAFHSFFVQAGIGSKYQVIKNRLEFELLYTNFIYGSLSEGAGETFNLGIRIIK